MAPKKVLLWAASDAGMDAMLFVLNVRRRLHARAAHDAQAFVAEVRTWNPDAVVLFWDGSAEREFETCGEAAWVRSVPILVSARIKRGPPVIHPSCWLGLERQSMADLLEALRILCQRKRGPKKATSRLQQAVAQAGANAALRTKRLEA